MSAWRLRIIAYKCWFFIDSKFSNDSSLFIWILKPSLANSFLIDVSIWISNLFSSWFNIHRRKRWLSGFIWAALSWPPSPTSASDGFSKGLVNHHSSFLLRYPLVSNHFFYITHANIQVPLHPAIHNIANVTLILSKPYAEGGVHGTHAIMAPHAIRARAR